MDVEAGPRVGEVMQQYKLKWMKEHRKKKKISTKRKDAAGKSWDKRRKVEGGQGNGEVDDEVHDDESESEDEENNNEFTQENKNALQDVETQYEFKEKDQNISNKGKKKQSYFYKLSEA